MRYVSLYAVLSCLLLLLPLGWAPDTHAAQLTLTWTDNATNEDGFAVERSTDGTGTFTQLVTLSPDLTSYIDSTVDAGAAYCYRLRAFNGAGYSDYSNVACASAALSYSLTVARSGTGTGTVTSLPTGITCGTDCSESYPGGTSVTLGAAAAAGSTFDGWSGGGCGGTGSCGLTLTANTLVTAAFSAVVSDPPSVLLSVSRAGKGSGTVTSAPAGIVCGVDCTEPYAAGSSVTLTAAPDPGSAFAGWSGACSGTGTCTVTLMADTAVTATFRRARGRK